MPASEVDYADSPVNVLRNYLLIIGAALGTSVVGALFCIALGLLSPGYASSTTGWRDIRYNAAMGAVMGLFLGAGIMMFCLVLAVLAIWFRPRNLRKHEEREAKIAQQTEAARDV